MIMPSGFHMCHMCVCYIHSEREGGKEGGTEGRREGGKKAGRGEGGEEGWEFMLNLGSLRHR